MLGFTALSCTGVLLLAITTNCLPWHSLDATKEITRSSEMEPWEVQAYNYEDVETPVKEVLKRSPDQDDLSESITVCGNRLAYTISYLCLKYGVGKKRSVGQTNDNILSSMALIYKRNPPRTLSQLCCHRSCTRQQLLAYCPRI